jgi:hypothetical protein
LINSRVPSGFFAQFIAPFARKKAPAVRG